MDQRGAQERPWSDRGHGLFGLPVSRAGLGFDDTSSVDTKELNVTTNGANPAAADAFLDFIIGPEAANIMAGYGYASPSTAADASLLGPVQTIATTAVGQSKVQFVLGDLLPGDLVDEYRVQLQKFLQDPSEATIDTVLAAIEARPRKHIDAAIRRIVGGERGGTKSLPDGWRAA